MGKVSARIRELLWQQVLENIGKGRAVMVHPANNEQGLDFRVRGQEWEPVDYEGLKLIMRPNSNKQQLNRQDNLERNERSKSKADIQRKKTGWSKVSRYRRYAR